ncbi:MAG: hypothetical protein WBF93_15005, partial [Pirellulales bacterium]
MSRFWMSGFWMSGFLMSVGERQFMSTRLGRTRFCSFLVLCGVIVLGGVTVLYGVTGAFAQQDNSGAATDLMAAETAAVAPASEIEVAEEGDLQAKLNRSVDVFVSDYLSPVLFYGIPTGLSQEVMDDAGKMIETPVKIPLILLTLVSGGFIFTFLHGFINLRLFGHSLQ